MQRPAGAILKDASSQERYLVTIQHSTFSEEAAEGFSPEPVKIQCIKTKPAHFQQHSGLPVGFCLITTTSLDRADLSGLKATAQQPELPAALRGVPDFHLEHLDNPRKENGHFPSGQSVRLRGP